MPLSGPKRQKWSEKGRARSTRGADVGRQTLPAPQLIVAALAHAPIAPIVSLERRGIAILYRLPEKGTKLVTWGAAMIKKKTMWIKPRLRAIQPCQESLSFVSPDRT